MQAGALLYQPYRNGAILLFFTATVAAIVTDIYWIAVIPFLYILMPWLLNQITTKPITIFWLLIVSIPFSTEINITDSLGIDFPDEVLLLLLTFLVCLKWVYRPDLFANFSFTSQLFILLLIHLCWILITIIFSTTPLLSVKYLLAKIWFIIPLVMLPSLFFKTTDFKKLAVVWLVPVVMLVIQVIIRHAAAGFSFEGIKETLSPFFRNHVAYSACLVCTLPIAFCLYKLSKKKIHRLFLKAVIIVLLIATFLSFSRGAWLALMVGALGAYVLHKKLLKQSLLVVVSLMIVALGWLSYKNNYTKLRPQFEQTIYHDEFGKHMQATVTLKDVSNAERFFRWVAGVKMVIAKPLTGFGANSFYANYKSYTDIHFRTWVSKNVDHSTVHNYYLLLAIEQGLPGMLLFIALLIVMLFKAQALYHSFQNNAYKAISLAIGTILIMIAVINTINDMIETDKIGSLFWLSLGLLLLLDKLNQNEMA